MSLLDFCSMLKITDQSDVKLGCSIFSDKLEDHPQIYKIGDIVRLHRVKVQDSSPIHRAANTTVMRSQTSLMRFLQCAALRWN